MLILAKLQVEHAQKEIKENVPGTKEFNMQN